MYVAPLYVFTKKIPSILHLSKINSKQYKVVLSSTSREISNYILLYFKLLYKAFIQLLSSISNSTVTKIKSSCLTLSGL